MSACRALGWGSPRPTTSQTRDSTGTLPTCPGSLAEHQGWPGRAFQDHPRPLQDASARHSTYAPHGRRSKATRAMCSQDVKVDPRKANRKRSTQPKKRGSEAFSRFWQIVNGRACPPGGEAHATEVLKPLPGAPPVEVLQGKLRHEIQS